MLHKILHWLNPFSFQRCNEIIQKEIVSLREEIQEIKKYNDSTFDDVLNEYRKHAEEQKIKAQFFSASLQNIGDILPDMIWMKWKNGKYAYANKAIRDDLLFDDSTIGSNAQSFFGQNKHNFGQYCTGSDVLTMHMGHRKRFIEYGMSGGKPLVLEVYKNVVRQDGDVVATVGCGRDITDNIFTMFMLEELAEGTDLHQSQEIIQEYLDKYLFENDTIPETLRDFYKNNKDNYYGR